MNAVEFVTLPGRDGGPPVTLQLSWKITEADLDSMRALHEEAFPIRYDDSYYKWLCTESCKVVVARVCGRDAASIPCETRAELSADGGTNETTATYSHLAGFCIGQVTRLRHGGGLFPPRPTGYLMSFAVDPALRRHGVGQLLLTRFVAYMFFKVPVPSLLYAEDSGPSFSERLVVLLKSLFSRISNFLWRDQKRGGSLLTSRSPEEVLDFPKQPLDVCRSNFQNGLEDVWLHCLASDKGLTRFYCSRGFVRARFIPGFYTFDGRSHNGMLLVIRRSDPYGLNPTTLALGSCQHKTHDMAGVGLCNSCTESRVNMWLDDELECIPDTELVGL